MEIKYKNSFLAYMAGGMFALSPGVALDCQYASCDLPENVVIELLDEIDEGELEESEFIELVESLSLDSHGLLRRRAAEMAGNIHADSEYEKVEALFTRFAADVDSNVRSSAAGSLARWLSASDGLTRSAVICSWALSDLKSVRLMLVRALYRGYYSPVEDEVIEHLGMDTEKEIRSAVVAAAQEHFSRNPDIYASVINRLSLDPSRRVRKAARRALVHLLRTGEFPGHA